MRPETALHPSPHLFPFESRFLPVAGARIHYVDEGAGPTLLMLHGNPSWSFLYRHLIMALRAEYRCIAIDLPGFGLSDVPEAYSFLPQDHAARVGDFLERLDIRDATLIAHDWGGPIGLAAALSRPGRLTRFVLGNSWAWPVNGLWHFEWFSRLMGGPLGRFGARRFNLFVNLFIPLGLRRGRLTREIMDGYRAPFRDRRRREGTHVFPREIIQGRDFLAKLEAGLRSLDGERVLFVWPEGDIAFRGRELARWRGYFPAAQVETIPRCGHFLWEEAPAETIAAIRSWLQAARPVEGGV